MKQIYAYVDGSDLDDIEHMLVERFEAFAASWSGGAARVVNDKFPRTADLREADLPDWNIGLNFPAASLSVQRLDELLTFLSRVAADTEQEFIIGEWVLERGISEDLAFIGSEVRQESVQFLWEQLGITP